jgi:hypothetical protein
MDDEDAMESCEMESVGWTAWLQILAAALILTSLNAAKPAHIDDAVFLAYAAEFGSHPWKPYDFEFGSPVTAPANHVLVPPLLPYWIGLGIRIFGHEPVSLKLWLFPFALILAWGVDFATARASPTLRRPVFWFCLISPIILPGFNFMTDVPVLALGLAALTMTMRSLETNSWRLMLASAVVAGLALQTKYTAVGYCASIFMWNCFQRRPLRGLITVAVALSIFIGWECFIAQTHGGSHFLITLEQRQSRPLRRIMHLFFPLLSEMAGLAPAAALLALAGLGRRKRVILATALLVVVGFGVIAVVPSDSGLFPRANGKVGLSLSKIVYGLMAVPVWWSLAGVISFLVRRGGIRADYERRLDWFLPLWFLFEMGVYYALSPFSAARRSIGMLFVFTLMAGRTAHYRQVSRRVAWACAAFGATLSLLFCYTDLLDARAARKVAHLALAVAHPGDGRTFWSLAYYGSSYYLEHGGAPPLRLNKQLPRPGDLVAVVEAERVFRESMAAHPELRIELIAELEVGDDFPLCLAIQFYAGGTPIGHHQGARVSAQVYRILAADAVPEADGS